MWLETSPNAGQAGQDLLCNIGHVKLTVLEEDFLDASLCLFSERCLTPTPAAEHPPAWLLVQGQRA